MQLELTSHQVTKLKDALNVAIKYEKDKCDRVYGTCTDGSSGAFASYHINPLRKMLEMVKENIDE